MKRSSLSIRHFSFAMAAALAVLASGCVHYVDPAKRNTAGDRNAYTRAEALPAEQRLVNALLADPAFTQHYAAKVAKKGGAVPVLQVAYFKNEIRERSLRKLDSFREDVETALRSSGRFILSGDPDAYDYILKGVYRASPDGGRVGHRIHLSLHDTAADIDVWTGSDEIAKE